jgi:hypothetical protein
MLRERILPPAIRILLILFGLSILLVMAGCGGGSSPAPSVSSTGPTPPTPSGGVSSPYFGMTAAFYEVGAPYADMWPTVSVGTLAKVNGTQWSAIEKSPGNYDWTNLDNVVHMAEANGAHEIIYTFYGVPSFYNANNAPCAQTGCAGPPSDLTSSGSPAFTNFVTALASRYKGQITEYELWNEGNRSGSWNGTTAQFVSLGENAYKTIKGIDPNAKVLSPSPNIASSFSSFIQSYLQSGGTSYSDGISWHGYHCADGVPPGAVCMSGTSCDNNALDCAGAPLINQIQAVRQAAEAAGVGSLPLYDTEGGWQQNQDLPDLTDQVAYISRWYIIQASEGIVTACWFGWGGSPTDPTAWGTIFDAYTGQTTEAATAYQNAYNWLSGSTTNGACSPDSSNVWSCSLTFSNGNSGLVVWNGNETDTTYVPATKYVQYEDVEGGGPVTFSPGSSVTIHERPLLFETGNRP